MFPLVDTPALEAYVRYAGGVLQLFGVARTIGDINETRQKLGAPGLIPRISEVWYWIGDRRIMRHLPGRVRRFLRFSKVVLPRNDVYDITAGVRVGAIATSELGFTGDTIEIRLSQVENYLREFQRRYERDVRSLRDSTSRLDRDINEQARLLDVKVAQTKEAIDIQLRELNIRPRHVTLLNLLILMLGIFVSTLVPEITRWILFANEFLGSIPRFS